MTTPTSGTAATSSPVSELDNRCSAVPSAIQGIAISTPAKAASGSSRLRSGANSPRLAASGEEKQRREYRPAEHEHRRTHLAHRVDSARSGQGPEAVVGTAARPSRRRRSVDRRSRVIRRHRDSRSFAAVFHESRGWLPPPRRSRTSPAGRCRHSRRRWRAHPRRASTTHRACSERSRVTREDAPEYRSSYGDATRGRVRRWKERPTHSLGIRLVTAARPLVWALVRGLCPFGSSGADSPTRGSLLKAISGGAVDRLPAQQAIRVQPVLELESRLKFPHSVSTGSAEAGRLEFVPRSTSAARLTHSTLIVAFWLTSSS
jgi:hypothetical protein